MSSHVTEKDIHQLGYTYKGKNLRKLIKAIGNVDNVSAFQLFLIENDGKFKSDLETITLFSEHQKMKRRKTYESFDEFERDYTSSTDKSLTIEKLFCSSIDSMSLSKVLSVLDNMDLQDFYSFAIRNREENTAMELAVLLECRHMLKG